jgi:hypothetical protein
MFIGHYAVGFAAKKWAPKVSLGTLLMAAIWLDLLWPIFVLLGLEHFTINQLPADASRFLAFSFTDYPLSHSLAMAVAWGAGFGLLYFIIARNAVGSWILGGLVVSHWFLDFIVHQKDLPLLPQQVGYYIGRYGLGLWSSMPATIAVEGALFTVGVLLYFLSTKSKDIIGDVAFWGLVLFMAVSYAYSILGTMPDNTNLVAALGQLQWLMVIWGYWVDNHREAV